VSNFDLNELKQVNPKPHVVQNWFDPFRQDRDVLAWCKKNHIAYTSYSTLGGQWVHQQVEGGGRRPNPIYERLRRVGAFFSFFFCFFLVFFLIILGNKFDTPLPFFLFQYIHIICLFSFLMSCHGCYDTYTSSVLKGIASKYGVDITKVVLSWALQRDVLVLPRSTSFEHMKENINFMEGLYGGLMPVLLSQDDLFQIDALDGGVDNHGECSNWAQHGECENNPSYMLNNCRASCGVGGAPPLDCDTLMEEGDEEEL
jgi:hypothetical protein